MSETSFPTLCQECRQYRESPICCTSCGALNLSAARDYDYFELFGLPRSFDLDTSGLHRKYLALARATHPDIAEAASPEARRNVLALNAELNQACETLKNPAQRASYLLSLLGGPSAADDKTVPGNVLGEVMMIREEMEEAQAAGDQATLETIRQQVQTRHETTMGEIAELARRLDTDAPEGFTPLRHALNTIKYWDNLLEQLPMETQE